MIITLATLLRHQLAPRVKCQALFSGNKGNGIAMSSNQQTKILDEFRQGGVGGHSNNASNTGWGKGVLMFLCSYVLMYLCFYVMTLVLADQHIGEHECGGGGFGHLPLQRGAPLRPLQHRAQLHSERGAGEDEELQIHTHAAKVRGYAHK